MSAYKLYEVRPLVRRDPRLAAKVVRWMAERDPTVQAIGERVKEILGKEVPTERRKNRGQTSAKQNRLFPEKRQSCVFDGKPYPRRYTRFVPMCARHYRRFMQHLDEVRKLLGEGGGG